MEQHGHRVSFDAARVRRPEAAYAWGFDAIRCLAMALVALRHWLSISGFDNHVIPRSMGLGIFCALSGYLAVRSGAHDRPTGWLVAKLLRIYPPYVLTLAAIFLLNYAYRYKPMSWDLLAAQVLGIAAFTHTGRLVGVHTWFISLILLCYATAALIRYDRRFLPAAAVVALALSRGDDFEGCILAFLAGCAVGLSSSPRRDGLGLILACVLAIATGHPEFSFPLRGIVALLVGMSLAGRPIGWLRSTREFCYEFYLVHGAVYLGLAVVFRFHPVANLLIGTPLAVLAAWSVAEVSRRGVEFGRRLLRERLRGLESPRETASYPFRGPQG
jgi:hypothetical protein